MRLYVPLPKVPLMGNTFTVVVLERLRFPTTGDFIVRARRIVRQLILQRRAAGEIQVARYVECARAAVSWSNRIAGARGRFPVTVPAPFTARLSMLSVYPPTPVTSRKAPLLTSIEGESASEPAPDKASVPCSTMTLPSKLRTAERRYIRIRQRPSAGALLRDVKCRVGQRILRSARRFGRCPRPSVGD